MTTAISLALVVTILTTTYVLWAAQGVAAGISILWFVAGAPLAAVAIPFLLTVQWFTVSWLFRSPRPAHVRLSWRRRLRLFWQEFVAIASSVPRMILYRWLLPDPPPAPAEMPVLLLHGVLCNAGVWASLVRALADRGIGPVYTLSYGPPLASIDSFADQTAARIEAILAATGARDLVVVGHSMGGLVARNYLRRHGAERIRRIITIGSPHHGSVLAYLFPGVSLAQLRPGNVWLAALNGERAADEPPILSLWSWHDSMVAPQSSSVLDRAENVTLYGVGHNALLADRNVHEHVAAAIRAATLNRV